MQEQSNSVYKTLAWLLLLVVIGLYALHIWHSGTLKEALSAQQAQLGDGATQLQEAKRALEQAARTQQGLRDEIDRLQASHRQQVQGLEAQLNAADQANTAIQGDLEAVKQHDAEALAAEQRRAADAYAELQSRLDAANGRIGALSADVEGLQRAQEDAAARHADQLTAAEQRYQARVAEIEAEGKDRMAALRTALEGSDPERAAMFAGLEQRIQSGQESIANLEAAKTDLGNQLGEATQRLAETAQTLTETQQALDKTQTALTETRGELAGLEARHDAAMDKAAMEQAALQSKYDAAVEKAARERSALEAQQAAALDQAAKERAALQAQHEAALAEAQRVRADLEARQQAELTQLKASHAERLRAAEDRIATLTASLASAQTALASLQAEHEQTVNRLSDTEKTLTGVRSDLSAAVESASQQKAALEQTITEAKREIAKLEETLATERRQNEAVHLADQQAHAQAMAHQRGLLVKVAELGGRQTEQGMRLTLAETDLRFPISKATLPAGELPSLDRISALLAEYPTLTARIEGHTDAAGREETNLALSQARADAVKQALVDRGVALERLQAVGLGETRPIADNATKAGSRQNRRVEIYLDEGTP